MGCFISRSNATSPCPSDVNIEDNVVSQEKIVPADIEETRPESEKRKSQPESTRSASLKDIKRSSQSGSTTSASPKTSQRKSQIISPSQTSDPMASESTVQPEVPRWLPELERTKEGHLVPQEVPKCDAGEDFVSAHEMYNSLNDGQRAPYLHDPQYMLILDVRDRGDYNESHITTARHSTAVDTEYDCLLSQGKVDKFTMVIVYDQGSTTVTVDPTLASFVQRLKDANVDVLILSGGYDTFHKTYPFLCNNLTIRSEQDRRQNFSSYPSVVLEDILYQGNVKHSKNETVLKNLKITHILNVSMECQNAFPKSFEYLQVKVEDESTEQLSPHLERAAKFIAGAINGGGRVLVHCVQGKSRSSTCTIAFLMSYRGWTLKDAHEYLKDRRSIAAPNRGFLIQLSKFEESIFGKVISSVDDLYF
ncbi:probable rhodanese domain-containing dual specificity protein phosphatase [Lytechinus variegatus]|uniref:probable rhodanese domain-containing dual specificity protein phosphatase n=1 Tax=Lytechinus variegatus TaxID=7654 RepID=UPI001BB1A339|nr:probable rhodanese domain-containing dual specificity protein phosphatase [Lytechinus variegatus]XP_041485386.1 probable rhodanese domain-containing dual specificity protein phosphatase [Lytechinus variegatus]